MSSASSTLMLDPDIRDWVVLPLFVIMVAAGLLRHYVGLLLSSPKSKLQPMSKRAHALLRQVQHIRAGGASHYISTYQWYVRKHHYVQLLKQEADWCQAEHEKREQEGVADDHDPFAAMNPATMLRGNMAFMVQNMVMMQGIQHFFSGFILLKVPFPLTAGFKSMFQRGLAELPDLEPSYVSSVSWYFLVMYGLRSFFRLAIGEMPQEVREQDMMMAKLGLGQSPQANPANPKSKEDGEALAKTLRQEAENIELFLQEHKSELDGVEKRLLGKQRYPKKKITSTEDETDLLLSASSNKQRKGKKKNQ